MTRTMKRVVSILLTLAMVVTSLSYTPKTVEAADDYSNLDFTEVTSGTGTYTYAYYVVSNSITGWNGSVEFYGDGVGMKLAYSADNNTDDTKVTINDVEKSASDSEVNEIALGMVALNPSVFEDDAYTKINITTTTGSAEIILRKGNPEGTTPDPETTTEPAETETETESESEDLDNLNWQTNDTLTAGCGEGTRYAETGTKLVGEMQIQEDQLWWISGADIATGSIEISINGEVPAGGTNSVNSALGYAIKYSSLNAGINVIVVKEEQKDGDGNVTATSTYTYYVDVPVRPVNISVNNYVSHTGKYIVKFDNVDDAVSYKVYINGAATDITLGGSGDYITYDELASYEAGDLTLQLTAVLSDGTETVKSTAVTINKPATQGTDNDIAQIYVQTDDTSINALTGLTKDKVTAAITVVDQNGVYSDVYDDAKKTTIKVRGNSTAGAEKKAFNISFSSVQNLLGLSGEGSTGAKKWSLLANAFDKSLIRNKIAMDFGTDIMGIPYNSNSRFIDLYLNGRYMGNYLLIESVETGDSRVEIDAENAESNDILLEIDNNGRDVTTDEHLASRTGLGLYFTVNSPEADPSDEAEHTAYLETYANKLSNALTYLNNFETALQNGDWTTISSYIDVDSFVDFYIANEFFKNQDVKFSSTRFYIKGGTLYAGPMWDYDLSTGNLWTQTNGGNEYTEEDRSAEGYKATALKWFELLMANSEFKALVVSRFENLLPSFQALYADGGTIDTLVASIQNSITRNYTSVDEGGAGWSATTADAGDTYSYAKAPGWTSYEASVEYYKDWLETRTTWLSAEWLSEEEETTTGTGEETAPDLTTVIANAPDVTATDGWTDPTAQGGSAVSIDNTKHYYIATSYYAGGENNNGFFGSAWGIFSSGTVIPYGGLTNNTVTGEAYAFASDKMRATGEGFESVWIDGVKLTAATDYYWSDTNDDVLTIAADKLTLGEGETSTIHYVTVRTGTADYTFPVKVEAVQTETSTPAETETVDQSGIVIPALDDPNWVEFKSDAANSTNVSTLSNDKFYVQSSFMTTITNTGNLGLYANTASLDYAGWGVQFTGENADTPLFSYVCDIAAGGNYITAVTIDGKTYQGDGINVCNGGDVVYINQALFALNGADNHIFAVTVHTQNGTTDEFALKVVADTTNETETSEEVTEPEGAEWTLFPNSTEYYYYIPSESTNYVNVGGMTDQGANTGKVYIPFYNIAAPFKEMTFNGDALEVGAGAEVWLPYDLFVENDTAYTLTALDYYGTTTVTMYVKKSTAPVYAPTGFTAISSGTGTEAIAQVNWVPTADAIAAGCTYTVTFNDVTYESVASPYNISLADLDYGQYNVVLKTYLNGNEVDSQSLVLKYKDPEAVDSTLKVTEQWEARRWEVLSWDAVENATGYAVYADGKLFTTTTDVTYNLPAYAFANDVNANGQPTTVGTHNVKVVALFGDAEAPATYDTETQSKATIGSHDSTLYVNYVYGYGTELWNNTGVDSVWNFTICESADDPNITTGADVKVTYKDDGSADLVFNDMGVHAGGDQAWTIKASIYDSEIEVGEFINLSFDIDGPAEIAGSYIMIKCTPEEVNADGTYAGDPYEEARYQFEPVYAEDGVTVVASVLHYSNSFEATNSTYDLLFGLGELEFKGDNKTLTLSDPKEVKVYGLKTLTATGIANVSDIDNSSIYVSWTTDVPVRLESEYTYQVSIDGTLVDEDATSGTTYEGYGVGSHEVKVVSIYNGANTSELTTTATIENVTNPDLVITDISVPTKEWFVGDTVPITITMKNIGNADAVLENAGTAGQNITVTWYVNGTYQNYFTQETDENSSQTLAAGDTLTQIVNYTIPENLVDGVHDSSFVIKAIADADGKISESDEDNNEYEKTFTFNAGLKEIILVNDGTDVSGSWEPEEDAKQYILQYQCDGEDKIVYVDANTTTYIFPEGEEPDNNSEVNVYAQGSDGSYHQIAKGTALADLELVEVKLSNGVAYLNENNAVVTIVKNVGVAKATGTEGNLFGVKTETGEQTWTTQNEVALAPNKTLEMTIVNGIPASYCTTAGTYSVWVNVDDASEGAGRIYESDDTTDVDRTRNNFKQLTFAAINRGTLTLNAPTETSNVTATWTDPNVNDTENSLTAEEYQLTYISNGTTVTKTATGNSFEFEDAIDNNTTVEISVKYEGIDGYHKLAEDTALADLIIETITVPDNTYLNEAFDIVVTIKNQGTAQVPATTEEFVEGYGGWIVVAMQMNANYNNGALMLGHTADGLLAGASANVTIEGVTGTVLSDAITGDTLTFAVDSPWGIENPTSYITEKYEDNNTEDATIRITAKPFEQQKMDWTPLYAQGDSENKERVLFTVANGTQNGYVEYKVLDTSFTDINYADLFTKYEGYNEGYTWMAMGIDNGHNVFAYDETTNNSTTSVNFQQVTSGFCNNYQQGDLAGMANILVVQNWNVVDAYGNPVTDKGDSPIVYDANGFLFSLNSFALGKYYVMNIVDSATNDYVTVAFRVMGETGSWIQAKSTNGPDDQIPIPYHEENAACTVNGKFYYDGSDLGLAVITVYNGDHLTLTTDTSMPIDLDNYKIEMAYASVDANGDFVSPTDGFVTITDGLGTEDQYRIQIKLPELIKDLPVHSGEGGLTDDEYYLMKVYPDGNDLTECIAIPIMIRAEIPMIEAVPSINAAINPDSDDSSVLSISWSETINQAAYDYHYDLEVYASEEAYNNGESALITETDAAPGAAYTYNTADYNLGTSVYVRVIANWCEQSIAKAATAVEEYNPGWREISGDSQIDVHAGQTEKVSVLGTVSFYDDVKVNHAYDVVGYNGMYINVAGNTSYYGPDEEDSVPIDGTASTVYISKGVTTVAELAAMTDDDYSEANTYEQTAGQIKINTQNEFEVSYSTTYYNVKVVKGDNTTIIKMKIEVTPGDVEVNAFQMNTDTSEGGVSEFNPSFRIVSRASKVVAVGEPFDITDENGETVTNVAIGSVKSYGTIYTTNADATVDTMKFGSEYVDNGEIEEGIYSFEATDMGKFSDDADLNSFYYALTIRGLTYLPDMLDTEYTVRAYAVTEAGDIVYGDKVETTSTYDIAKVLYDNSMMSTEANHNYLYDNVLNIVAIKNNWLNIGNAMLKALNVTTKNDDYALINNAYKDLYYYINLARDYRVDKYYERGAFVCKTPTNGLDTETALLARLNTVTTDGKQYDSVAEWIENEAAAQGYEGFYKRVVYNPLQTANNVATGDGTE